MHRLFFNILLVLLPTQLGYHLWPQWAYVLGRRVDYLSPTLYLTDILILLTVGSWVFNEISNIKYSHEAGSRFARQASNFKNVFVLLALGIFAFFNIYFSTSPLGALYKWLKVIEFTLLGWYVVSTKPSPSLITYHLSLGVVYSSLLTIAQFILQRSVGGPLWWLGERTFTADTPGIARVELCDLSRLTCHLLLRPHATFPHPNVLGGYLAVTLPLVLNELIRQIIKSDKLTQRFNNITIEQLKKRIRSAKALYFAAMIFGVIALVLTFSRGAWAVGTLAMVGTIAHIKYQKLNIKYALQISKRKRRLLLFLLILSGLFLVLGIPLRGTWFLVRGLNLREESVVVRAELNRAALTLWQQSPLLGVGLGNFLVELPKALPSRQIYFLQPVHNVYLLVLAETGIIGLTAFVWLILMALRNFQFSIFNFQFSFLTLLLLGLVDHYLVTLQQGQLLFTLLLVLSAGNAGKNS